MTTTTSEAIIVDRQHRLGKASIERETSLGSRDVRVSTHLAGVCATDREIVRTGAIFRIPEGDDFLVLGHEVCGRVVETGPGVGDLSVGDWVVPVVTPQRNRGIDSHGYFRDSFIDSADWLVKVPADVADIAVLVEPITISHHALREALALRAERTGLELVAEPTAAPQRALVVGAGPIGLLGALLCRLWGYPTTVIDVVTPGSPKAEIAHAAGCDYVVADASEGSEMAGAPFDLVLHTAPSPDPILRCLPKLERGGVLSLVGWQGGPHEVSLDLARLVRDAVHEEWALVGTLGARPVDFRGAVAALAEMRRCFPTAIDRVITRVCPADRFEDAFDHRPDDVAVAIDFDGGGDA